MATPSIEDFGRLLEESLGKEIAGRVLPALFGEGEGLSAVRFNLQKESLLKESLQHGPFTSADECCGLSLGESVPWCPQARYLKERPNFALQPLFHAGAYYVQDPSCTFLNAVWNSLPEESNAPQRVLDLCAAPGGKSTLLSDLMNGKGLLLCNEVISSRAAVLAENMARWGAANSIVSNSDPSAFSSLEEYFDFILVDAPCSGEGMFRKNPDALSEWSPESVQLCAKRQRRILNDIWPALAPGGVLVYSTCTFNHLENMDNVRYLVEELGAEPLQLTEPEWTKMQEAGVIRITGVATSALCGYQFLPGLVMGEGQFFAMLRKPTENETSEEAGMPVRRIRWSREIKGDLLKLIPEELQPELKRLSRHIKIISSGTAVATLLASKRGGVTLVPHADLALSAHIGSTMEYLQENYKFKVEQVELPLEQMLRFLAKEEIRLPDAPSGYLLLTYKGRGVGFVKNLGNRCNSLLPNARRIKVSKLGVNSE